MSIDQSDLTNAAARSYIQRNAAVRSGQSTAFLCHSHKDRELAFGLQQLMREQGLDLYIDWQDISMPEQPNGETAGRLRQRIVDCNWFLFLATNNSMTSRWCPWELGYADGKKSIEKIAVIPTHDGLKTHGNEYMQLYRRIDRSSVGTLAIFSPNAAQGTFIQYL